MSMEKFAAFEQMRVMVIAFDHCGQLIYANPEFRSNTGLESPKGTAEDIFVSVDGFRDQFRDILLSKTGSSCEAEIRIATGMFVPVELFVSSLKLEEEYGQIIIAVDITENKNKDRLRNEFISTVSHELRTPLTCIHGTVRFLSESNSEHLSERSQDLLKLVLRNCERLEHIIRDILCIEKLNSDEVVFEPDLVDSEHIIKESLELNRVYSELYSVDFTLGGIDKGLINVDIERFHQIMSNLLSNAAKFSHKGGEVIVSATDNDSGMLIITVKDYGVGMPDSFRDKVFEKFSRADEVREAKIKGSGLGMSITRSLVEKMNGRISVESDHGAGTTVYLEFPLKVNA